MTATAWGVDVVRAVAIPLAIVVVLLVLRRPLSTFLESIGGRVKKVSFGKLSLELATASELRPAWQIDTGIVAFDVRQLSPSEVFDSYADSLLSQLDDPRPIDFVVVDLGAGGNWLSSRLFLFADLLGRMRGLRALVFVATVGSHDRRFLGMATPLDVRWRLAQEFPALEQALVYAYDQVFPPPPPAPNHPVRLTGFVNPIVVSDTGAVGRWQAGAIARRFLETVQSPIVGETEAEWTSLRRLPPDQPIFERAVWLNTAAVQRILEPCLSSAEIAERDADDISRAAQALEILRCDGDFVAVTREGTFDRLIDRRALVEQAARLASKELAPT